jgi:phage tail sheath protein FI
MMPITPTYPGVYVEEIPSGIRTITGVATSITAFLGRAQRGPVNEPVTINSFGDFERTYGGLGEKYPMSYAVKDFYLNGGSQAIIVRLYHPYFAAEDERQAARAAAQSVAGAAVGADAATAAAAARKKAKEIKDDANKSEAEKEAAEVVAKAAEDANVPGATADDVTNAATVAVDTAAPRKAHLNVGDLTLEAVSEGTWANSLRARVEGTVPQEVATRYGLQAADMFNLLVRDGQTGTIEKFLNVSVKPSVRQLDRVLENESNLIKVTGPLPANPPAASDDGLSDDDLKKPLFSDERSVHVADADKASAGAPLSSGDYTGSEDIKTGMFALNNVDLFNLLCIPPDTRDGNTPDDVYQAAMAYCFDHRAMLIVDPKQEWSANKATAAAKARDGVDDLGLSGPAARNAALFFPRVLESDPQREGQIDTFVPCGLVAGVMARTDAQRGVWKAPAGLDAAINGIQGLEVNLNDAENGMLNPLGINCLRSFPVYGRVVWGARTRRGADQLGDEYKYIPVRRTALYIEESLYRGLKWVVFEPNDEPLWIQIRLNVGAFLHNLFRQGAFQGKTPREAYFVKCDKETTTQNDINLGIVNVVVGFAPLKPAEFVIIKLQQIAGQIEV